MNVFNDPILLLFAGFQRTLDSEMKWLRVLGLGVKKQAEPITIEEEKARFGRRASWETQTLKQLLDTTGIWGGTNYPVWN